MMDTKQSELIKMRNENRSRALWLASQDGIVTDSKRLENNKKLFDIQNIVNELVENQYHLSKRYDVQNEVLRSLIQSVELIAREVSRLSKD